MVTQQRPGSHRIQARPVAPQKSRGKGICKEARQRTAVVALSLTQRGLAAEYPLLWACSPIGKVMLWREDGCDLCAPLCPPTKR